MDKQLFTPRGGRGMREGQRDAQKRVGSQATLVRRAVESEQLRIKRALIVKVHADHGGAITAATLLTALSTPRPP